MELIFLILSSFVFLFFLIHGLELYRKRRLPPGPAGLPIIGNLLDLGRKPHESLAKLALKHGPLMTIRLGSITSVVASTPDAAREILLRNDEACSGRLVPDSITALSDHHNAAVLWIPAQRDWRAIRKALNTFLTNRQKIESLSDLRQNVLAEMLGFIREAGKRGEAVDIGKVAFATGLNQMSNTFLSQNVTSYESEDVGGFKTAVMTLMEVNGQFNIADIFPVLKPLDPQKIRRRAKVAYDWFDKVTEDFVAKRLKHRAAKLPRFNDLLDSLLDYSQDHEAEFSLKHIKVLLVDMFQAGSEPNSNTTEWVMTELLLNPKIFAKVREEVSQTVGENGTIEESKILHLPYLHAVIKESMRLHFAVPFLVPHKTETEVKLDEYIIPKNTRILINAWAMARDPRYWENPTVFMPERFLESEVDYKGQHFAFIPFGSGRRLCPGIPLAYRVVSLMVASLVYHFDWKLPYPKEEMDMNVIYGLTLQRASPLEAIPIPIK